MTVSNLYATPKVYANVGLKLLKNNLVMAKLCDSEGIDAFYEPGSGTTVNIKRPPEFIVRDGAVASPQSTQQGEVAVTIDKQKGVDTQFTSVEQTTNVDALLKSQVIDGAMSQIASQIDSDLIAMVNQFPNWVGTPGNLIDSPADFFLAPQRLDEMAIPASGRNAILTPGDGYAMAGNLLALASQQGDVAKTALQKAEIPVLGNCKPYMTQTIPSLTTGTRTASGATLINGAAQISTYAATRTTHSQNLVCDTAGNAKTVKAGEVITIAGVNAVNPRTKADLGYLRQFVVLADAVSDGSGNITLSIAPQIISDNTSPYQNVTAAPADNAAVTYLGAPSTTFRTNAAFHKSAIKLVSVKLVMPFTGECDYATDPDTGLTVRYWRYSDGGTDTHNHRWDVFYGVANVDRRLGTRISGTP